MSSAKSLANNSKPLGRSFGYITSSQNRTCGTSTLSGDQSED